MRVAESKSRPFESHHYEAPWFAIALGVSIFNASHAAQVDVVVTKGAAATIEHCPPECFEQAEWDEWKPHGTSGQLA